MNAGGSTGDPFFRPLDAPYEAAAITVEGCTFSGGETPIAFVGVHGVDPKFEAPEKGAFKPLAPAAAGFGATAFKPPKAGSPK